MNFCVKTIPKKYYKFRTNRKPFPQLARKIKAIFTGFSVEILDSSLFSEIFENGCYGKGSHSRSAPISHKICLESTTEESSNHLKTEESLVLDLEETIFLMHFLNSLEVNDIDGNPLTVDELFTKILRIKPEIPRTFAGYIYLKSKNWIIKSGIKFGGDFLIYKDSQRSHHASFIVIINDESIREEHKYIQGLERIGETSNKDILILEITLPSSGFDFRNFSTFISNLDEMKISELILTRLDWKQYVNTNK